MYTGFTEYLEKKQLKFLALLNMAASNLHALLAVLALPPERIGKVCRPEIFRTPIPFL
jgi:hypothetical protein